MAGAPAIGTLRARRLAGGKAFARVFREGRRYSGVHVQVIAAAASDNGAGSGRLGYIIPKQHFRRAVDRNYVRRILREALRQRRLALGSFDIVMRVRAGCPRAALAALAAETAGLLDALAVAASR
ncbi:MAG: ribonuclease P protein component [Betaproteobacteria bacterium]